MSKVYTDFDAKLHTYGQALREYDLAMAAWKDAGYPKGRLERDVDNASKWLDRLRGPMDTALRKLAVTVAE